MPHQNEDKVRERAYAIWEQEGRPEGKADDHWLRAHDEALDEAIDDSFPASDPPAITQPRPKVGKGRSGTREG